MQPVLPTSLDMASARVLGFDATAYINDTNSTLHQRLNIPSNFAYVDNFASTTKTNKKNNKNKVASILAGIAIIAAGTTLGISRVKGKFKLKNIKVFDGVKAFAGKISNFFLKNRKKI